MKARIYKPGKSATQSGFAKTENWVLEYEAQTPRTPEALMGWTAAGDTLPQVKIKFPTREAAEDYAKEKGLEYTVSTAHVRKIKPRNYTDNFKYVPPASAPSKKKSS